MAWYDIFFWNPLGGAVGGTISDVTQVYQAYDAKTDVEKAVSAKKFLLAEAAILGIGAAPALYALSLHSKRKLKPGQERLGVSLENAASTVTGPLVTALAAPAIATAIAYITVQKMEDAGYIKKGLGDAAQGLLTVAAAGPAIQGFASFATSAFKTFPKGK